MRDEMFSGMLGQLSGCCKNTQGGWQETGLKLVATSATAERQWVVGFQVRSRKCQLAKSVDVFVRVQKNGRLPTHPIGKTKGKVMSCSSSGC